MKFIKNLSMLALLAVTLTTVSGCCKEDEPVDPFVPDMNDTAEKEWWEITNTQWKFITSPLFQKYRNLFFHTVTFDHMTRQDFSIEGKIETRVVHWDQKKNEYKQIDRGVTKFKVERGITSFLGKVTVVGTNGFLEEYMKEITFIGTKMEVAYRMVEGEYGNMKLHIIANMNYHQSGVPVEEMIRDRHYVLNKKVDWSSYGQE